MSESTLMPSTHDLWKRDVVLSLNMIVDDFNAKSGLSSYGRYSWAFDEDGHKYLRPQPLPKDEPLGLKDAMNFNEFFKNWQVNTGCTANFKWENYVDLLVLKITEIVLPLYKDEGPAPDAFAKAILAVEPTKVAPV